MSHAYTERDNLIIKYLPLVKKVVGRIESKDSAMDKDDLVSIGVMGLMDAIDKYDQSKKVPFEVYASLRIKGTVIDELRKTGKVSRDRIEKLNRYYEAKESLEKRLMRTPDESDICSELNIDEKDLSKIHQTVHYLSSYSLESTLFTQGGDDFSLMDMIMDESIVPVDEAIIQSERKEALAKAIDMLKEREKIILNLYYVEELPLKDIAYALDISIPRVSQIHGKVLLKLKEILRSQFKESGGLND